jgi:hypothetical protein
VKSVGRKFENRNSGAFSACGATTSHARIRWRLPLDSARQIGIGSIPHDCLTVVVMVFGGGEVCLGANILLADLERFWVYCRN